MFVRKSVGGFFFEGLFSVLSFLLLFPWMRRLGCSSSHKPSGRSGVRKPLEAWPTAPDCLILGTAKWRSDSSLRNLGDQRMLVAFFGNGKGESAPYFLS